MSSQDYFLKKDLVVDLEVLLPRPHDEGVVNGDTGDGVDSLGLELGGILHEPRKVLLGAGRGERAGYSEEDGLLALGEVGDGGCLELAGRVEAGECSVGKLVTDGDGGGDVEGGGCGGAKAEETRGGATVVADLEGEGDGVSR